MGKQQEGLQWLFQQKVEQLELMVKEKTHNLRRLEAQRNELNTQGERRTREERHCNRVLGCPRQAPYARMHPP